MVLARLAFSEGVFLDAGIHDETVGMARDMLEESVTPEEAEGLLEAFPEFARRVERGVREDEQEEEAERGGEEKGEEEEQERQDETMTEEETMHHDVIDVDEL